MFLSCEELKEINIPNYDFKNVEDILEILFNCKKLEKINAN